jgi:hypothetical protein
VQGWDQWHGPKWNKASALSPTRNSQSALRENIWHPKSPALAEDEHWGYARKSLQSLPIAADAIVVEADLGDGFLEHTDQEAYRLEWVGSYIWDYCTRQVGFENRVYMVRLTACDVHAHMG